MIKKIMSVLALFALAVFFYGCSSKGGSVVGKWIDADTEQIYEYAADGYFYEYTNESFTSDKTRYKVKSGKITYYIEDVPESEYSVKYEIKDGNLVINGTLVYKPYSESVKTDN